MINKKDKAILKDAAENGTPIFILTAKDKLSIDAILEYWQTCCKNEVPNDHILAVRKRLSEFEDFQIHNVDKVKLPD